jgi:hypothetical protein
MGLRATGLEPVWTGSGAATLEFRSGGFQARCVYQFHHTRMDNLVASKKAKKKGPVAERVKVKGDWGEAIKKALNKPRPSNGWPKEIPPK